ncbi:MAG: peptidase MA family metallohydrolase [Candidatus Limnocylindrales bacterium]
MAFALAVAFVPAVALAADPVFGQPTATAELGGAFTFNSSISDVRAGTVEVLVGLAVREPRVVLEAQPGNGDTWTVTSELDVATSMECSCLAEGQSAPNTRVEYQFRVRNPDGSMTVGPVAEITVEDDRFEWQSIEAGLVRVHWYEGDQAFAQAAADVANSAIDRASNLLGTTLPVPVDLFVYSTQQALLEAVSPQRENIAGEAHSNIATMFVWIPPSQNPSESAVTVAHELTHLVFNEATLNQFHGPPRWLNEGIATYLSEGYSPEYQAIVNVNASTDSLIPLDGLAGFFPSPPDQFYLAYGESVAAVDYFVRTYSEQTLWDLVRGYAQGVSDNEAFQAATGADAAAFNTAWMGSLGADVPDPRGPQPAPPGPVPTDWLGEVQPATPPPTLAPGQTPTPPATLAPGQTARPAQSAAPVATPLPGTPQADSGSTTIVFVALAVVAILLIALIALVFIQRGRNRRPPPPPFQPPPWSC